ncbi:hypothetical protein Pyn_36790 [Prunus yedoensis var. nudiflora]|uniref:Uncharacterized protein n=1 Tax=Prunus yedoensis var. nudiflora TaxID=2094558 RepID=A0A314Z2E3_PRUYE|nr:hypothetical protein Pyn_36790 [Prunus yedoensis var. nudiflora]
MICHTGSTNAHLGLGAWAIVETTLPQQQQQYKIGTAAWLLLRMVALPILILDENDGGGALYIHDGVMTNIYIMGMTLTGVFGKTGMPRYASDDEA